MQKVLFVCMGNICRSAMAEGILLNKVRQHNLQLEVDSAGTHGFHNGKKYDERARAELKCHDIDIEAHRSRQVEKDDLINFDVIFVADRSNLRNLRSKYGKLANKVKLMTAFSKKYRNEEIPDPYYGGEEGFRHVYRMLNESINAWLYVEEIL